VTCQGGDTSTFVVLGGPGGWRAAASAGVDGVEPAGSLRLGRAAPGAGVASRTQVDSLLAPSWLSPDGAGGWGLIVDGRLWLASGCAGSEGAFVATSTSAGAIAVDRAQNVALTRPDEAAIDVYAGLHRRRARIRIPGLRPDAILGWGPGGVLFVICPTRGAVSALTVEGAVLWSWSSPLLLGAERIGVVRHGTDGLIAVVAIPAEANVGWWRLYRLEPHGTDCVPLTVTDLVTCLVEAPCTAADGFALPAPPGPQLWFDRSGRRRPTPIAPAPELAREGSLRTVLLDAGRPDARWYRARLDADQPAGTSVRLRATAVAGDETSPRHSYVAPEGATDLLLHLPAGRFLQVELDLRGDGLLTPTVRNIWLEVDSPSTLDLLPSVYRRDLAEAEFTRRFLALFDAELAEIDQVIREAHGLLDPAAATELEHLAALAGLVGLDLDPGWDPARVRSLLRRPDIIGGLGTAAAFPEIADVLLGLTVHVEELGRLRNWTVVGGARAAGVQPLGGTRLYGRTTRANLLGRSALGSAPLVEPTDAEEAADSEGAFAIVVHVARSDSSAPLDRVVIERSLRRFLPAHLDVTIRFAEPAAIVGGQLLVGIDTRLAPAPAGLVIAEPGAVSPTAPTTPGVRLGATVLAGGTVGGGGVVTVGRRARVGVDCNVA
jgi:phage tail-like protein